MAHFSLYWLFLCRWLKKIKALKFWSTQKNVFPPLFSIIEGKSLKEFIEDLVQVKFELHKIIRTIGNQRRGSILSSLLPEKNLLADTHVFINKTENLSESGF